MLYKLDISLEYVVLTALQEYAIFFIECFILYYYYEVYFLKFWKTYLFGLVLPTMNKLIKIFKTAIVFLIGEKGQVQWYLGGIGFNIISLINRLSKGKNNTVFPTFSFQNYAATHRQNSRRKRCNGLPSMKQKFYFDTFNLNQIASQVSSSQQQQQLQQQRT